MAALAVFILEDALSAWTNLGNHLLLVCLWVSTVTTDTRRIICLEELPFVVRLERRTMKDRSSGRIMLLAPNFILETHNSSRLTNVSAATKRPMKLSSSKEDVKLRKEQFMIGWKINLDIIFVIQLWLPWWNLIVPDDQIPSSYATPGFKPFSTCFPFISSIRWIDRTR